MDQFSLPPGCRSQKLEYITYATPNKAAKEMLDKEIQNNKAVFPDAKQLKTARFTGILGMRRTSFIIVCGKKLSRIKGLAASNHNCKKESTEVHSAGSLFLSKILYFQCRF